MKIGTLIRVIYPEYAAQLMGVIQAEEKPNRWIVKLENNPFEYNGNPVLLSLEESDFEVIGFSPNSEKEL